MYQFTHHFLLGSAPEISLQRRTSSGYCHGKTNVRATSKGDMLTHVSSSCPSAGQSQRAGTAADAGKDAFPGQLCFTHLQSFTVSFPLLCDWLNLFLFHLWGKKLLICLLHFSNNTESYELCQVLLGAVIHVWYSVAIYFKFNSIGLREWNLWDFNCLYFLISILWVRVVHLGECFLCTRNACLFCDSQMPCSTDTSYIKLTADMWTNPSRFFTAGTLIQILFNVAEEKSQNK